MIKNKIIETVINMVLKGNIDTLSMSKIAKEAGIGKSTIYEYFNNKEEMMLEAAKVLIDQYVEIVLNCEFGKNMYESFYNHMIIAIKIGKEVFQLADMARQNCISFLATDEIKEIGKKGFKRVIERFDDIFERGIDEGTIKPQKDLKSQKYIVYGLMKGSFLCNIGDYAVNDEQYIKDVYEALLKILNN